MICLAHLECEILIGSSVSIAQGLNTHAKQTLKCFPTQFLVQEILPVSKKYRSYNYALSLAQKVLCHRAKVAKAFQCCKY